MVSALEPRLPTCTGAVGLWTAGGLAQAGASPQLWGGSPTRHRVMVICGVSPCSRGGWAGTGPDAWRQGYIPSLAGRLGSLQMVRATLRAPTILAIGLRRALSPVCWRGPYLRRRARRSPPLTPAGTWRAGSVYRRLPPRGCPAPSPARLWRRPAWNASAQTCWRTPIRSSSCLRVLVFSMLLMTLLLGLSDTRLSPDARQQCPADLVARISLDRHLPRLGRVLE